MNPSFDLDLWDVQILINNTKQMLLDDRKLDFDIVVEHPDPKQLLDIYQQAPYASILGSKTIQDLLFLTCIKDQVLATCCLLLCHPDFVTGIKQMTQVFELISSESIEIEQQYNCQCKHVILVLPDSYSLNTHVIEALREVKKTVTIELFELKNLKVKPLINFQSPYKINRVLNEVETKDVIKRKFLKDRYSLPRHRIADPIAKWFGCKEGHVLEIQTHHNLIGRGAFEHFVVTSRLKH